MGVIEVGKQLWKGLFTQPAEGFYLCPMVHITCNRSIEVEGCRSVLEFEEGRLVLDMGRWQLTLLGQELCIRAVAGKRLVIDGTLLRTEFEPLKKER